MNVILKSVGAGLLLAGLAWLIWTQWNRPTDHSENPSAIGDRPSVIDLLRAQSSDEPATANSQLAQGREAMALDTSIPDRSLPPLIDYSALKGTSHQKMIQALAEIRDLGLYEAGFFGNVTLEVAQQQLTQIPDSDLQKRYNALMRLGMRRLWRGDTQQSILHYLAAYELVKDQPEHIVPASAVTGAAYQVGLAYLRKAENENCVQCNNGESCLLPIRDDGIHQQTEGSTEALKYLQRVLEREPNHAGARWLFNVASMTLGQYPDQVPDTWQVPTETFLSEVSIPRFPNVATAMGLSQVNLSGGVIWEDFDGDGDLDLITSSWGAADPLLYFRNDGGDSSGMLSMVEATEQANLEGLVGGLNLIQADYDNDGDCDVLVLRGAWSNADGRIPNSLLQNDGTGRFTDVTFDVGLADQNYPTQTAVWFDLENDGDLDLFIGNEKYPCQLFRNDHGQFQDIASGEAVRNFRFTKGVIAGDINGDGWTDLYLSNHGQKNRLLINDGKSGFTDQAANYSVEGPLLSFPAWFWDYNNDGHLDLLVTGYSYGHTFVSETYLNQPTGKETMRLYQGSADGFRDVTEASRLARVVQPMGANIGDLNNDGFLDFYLGTGCPEYDTLMPNLMYLNQAGQTFADVTTSGGFGHLQKGHAISFADIDNDGDQDIFAQMGGAYPGDAAANALYKNPLGSDAPPGRPWQDHHWVTLQLEGTVSNRSAIGARITVRVTLADGTEQTIYRWVGSGGSFGANPLRQSIGLGPCRQTDQIEVFWPASGKNQVFPSVLMDRFYRIRESDDQLQSWDLPASQLPSP